MRRMRGLRVEQEQMPASLDRARRPRHPLRGERLPPAWRAPHPVPHRARGPPRRTLGPWSSPRRPAEPMLTPPPPPAVACGRRVARACDGLPAFCVLAFAAWTPAYHACLALGLGSSWALAALAAGLVPRGLLAARPEAGCAPAWRGRRTLTPCPLARAGAPRRVRGDRLVPAAAAALASTGLPWPVVWAPWPPRPVAVLLAGRRGPLVAAGPERSGAGAALVGGRHGRAGAAADQANSDDAYYLRCRRGSPSTGVSRSATRCTPTTSCRRVFSPPLPSLEALVGSLADAAGVTRAGARAPRRGAVRRRARGARAVAAAARGGPHVAAALSAARVPAVRRRAGRPPRRGTSATCPATSSSRAWQGKVILVVVLVPLLYALLHEYAARPRASARAARRRGAWPRSACRPRRRFLVPVIAACSRRARARAAGARLPGSVAVAAYPVAAAAAALSWPPACGLAAAGPRAGGARAVRRSATAGSAFVAVTAALAGLLLLARHARLGVAAATLAAAPTFTPGVPQLIYDVTGLGRPSWRLMWRCRSPRSSASSRPSRPQGTAAPRCGCSPSSPSPPWWRGRNPGGRTPPARRAPAPGREPAQARRAGAPFPRHAGGRRRGWRPSASARRC